MGKGFFGWRRALPTEASELEQSLQETRLLLAQAYAGFNSASDSELVESYIYEIQSLQARYSYLLRRRKAMEPAAAPALPASRRTRGTGKGSPEATGSAVLPVA